MRTRSAGPVALSDTPAGIQVRGFRAGYANRQIVHDVSLTLPAGRISVVVGPGGSGKTTFVKALLGESCPQLLWRAGNIEIAGSSHRAQWQNPTGDGVLGTLLAPPDTSSTLVPQQARRVLDRVWPRDSLPYQRLEPRLDIPVAELAAWYSRLAAFTRTIAVPASLYIFDEPDADGPTEVITPLAERIRGLAPAATVLLVTHNLQLARKAADYVVLMIDGEIIEEAECGEFFQHPTHPRTRDFVRLGC